MKVKCINNKIQNCNETTLISQSLELINNEINLNSEYTVYALHYSKEELYYYLCPEGFEDCPRPYISYHFEIIDNRVSSYWSTFFYKNELILSFKEFYGNDSFFEKLFDGSKEEELVFQNYKKLMDEEFSDLRMKYFLDENSKEKPHFQNQYGVVCGNIKNNNLIINKWYNLELRFNILLEIETHVFFSYEHFFYTRIENDRLILNLKILEIEENAINSDYSIILNTKLGDAKIKIPIVPVLLDYKVGDFIIIKIPIKNVEINVLND